LIGDKRLFCFEGTRSKLINTKLGETQASRRPLDNESRLNKITACRVYALIRQGRSGQPAAGECGGGPADGRGVVQGRPADKFSSPNLLSMKKAAHTRISTRLPY